MNRWVRCLLAFVASANIAVGARQSPTAADRQNAQLRWYKGNTHTHTLNSDGDSSPDDVVRWYREHAYDFLVLTDHNFVTSVDGLNALHGAEEKFLVIKGEEVSDRFANKPLHINGLDVRRTVPAQGGTSVLDVLNRNIAAIRAENGIPHVNHPNFGWAITREELQQVRGTRLFEIFNGHPFVNNLGGGGVPGLEEVWDALLSSNVLLYGVAVDDAHTFKQPGNPNVAGPGRGWVVVRAPRLEARTIVEAIERGEFYASTGVELQALDVAADRIHVAVKPVPSSKYRIQFIGKGGHVLEEALGTSATYVVKGTESYVRARVLESNGRMAWVQPLVIRGKGTVGQLAWLLSAVAAVGALGHWRRRGGAQQQPPHRTVGFGARVRF
jgi:hypothetical protein